LQLMQAEMFFIKPIRQPMTAKVKYGKRRL
jgi:hypothetical protein